MDVLTKTFANIEFLKPQTYENITIVGLKTDIENNTDILHLKKALDLELVEINEINEAGTVDTLKVKNESNVPLLILDGEELIGAKQNRILNTTVLIPPKTEIPVPVSCTERGRWAYNTPKFEKTNNIASGRIRFKKNIGVYHSLKKSNAYKSDQREIWDEINNITCDLKTFSKTEALSDTFEHKKHDITDYIKNLKYNKGQTGTIIFINNQLINMELVFNTSIYKQYHEKIIKSNALDGLTYKNNENLSDIDILFDADNFLKLIEDNEFEKFESIGIGEDYRIKNENLIGSMLNYNDNIWHALFFNKNQNVISESL